MHACERNPAQFSHVDNIELGKRKEYCLNVRREIRRMKLKMHDKKTTAKIESDKRSWLKARQKQRAAASAAQQHGGLGGGLNPGFSEGRQQQQMLQARQEVQLQDLSRGVGVLEEAAGGIHDELVEQGEMLDELQQDLDLVDDRMQYVMLKMEEILKTKNRCTMWTIIILIIVAIVLLCLVVWT